MDPAIEAVLGEYEERSRREWSGQLEGSSSVRQIADARDRMLLSVGREAGAFINALAKASGARQVLELGTSYGYSTLWFAEAMQATGGKVVSLDVADYKQAHARQQLQRVGLQDRVEFHTGDALEILRSLEGPFDFVLLDIWKDLYVPCLELFLPKLARGAIVVADNMLRPESDRPHALAYRKAVRAKPGISSVLLPLGQGLEVSRFEDL
jgi:predicted O-methyltransferase YrrM